MRDIEQIIVAAADADFDAHIYTRVYASSSATPTINGTAVGLIAGGTLQVLVKEISATNNVFLLGRKKIIPPSVING
jgi:hypothetical protein